MHANKREEIKHVWAGDIAAAVGLKERENRGHDLRQQHPVSLLESMDFPEPVIRLAIEPKTKDDQEQARPALFQAGPARTPPSTWRSIRDTGQTIIAGMGELHLEVLVEIGCSASSRVGANVGKPQVAYRETIRRKAEVGGAPRPADRRPRDSTAT